MSTYLVLFYDRRLGNHIHSTFIFFVQLIFKWFFFLHTVIIYQTYVSNINNLHTSVWFQVFPSNTNNYMVSSD